MLPENDPLLTVAMESLAASIQELGGDVSHTLAQHCTSRARVEPVRQHPGAGRGRAQHQPTNHSLPGVNLISPAHLHARPTWALSTCSLHEPTKSSFVFFFWL